MTLLSRVEALTGPDRAIDAELAKMRGASHMAQEFPPPYTASVDYALAFAEKALNIASFRLINRKELPKPCIAGLQMEDGTGFGADASTLPLAIILAVLRAKEGT